MWVGGCVCVCEWVTRRGMIKRDGHFVVFGHNSGAEQRHNVFKRDSLQPLLFRRSVSDEMHVHWLPTYFGGGGKNRSSLHILSRCFPEEIKS